MKKASGAFLSAALVAAALAASAAMAPAPAAPRPAGHWRLPLRPAPLVSRGARVASSHPGAAALVDGVYRGGKFWGGGFPTPGRPAWVALRLDGGYRRLLLSWTSSGNHGYDDVFYGAPADYRLETSADSRDGRDGHWRTAAEVRGNAVRTRAHAVDFEGQRWLRLSVTALPEKVNPWGLWLDEIDVHDLSAGGDDVWVFLGDSIGAGVFDRAPEHQPSFAEIVARLHPGYFPAVVNAGIPRLKTAQAVEEVERLMRLNPEARVIAVGVGSNDNDPAAYRRDLDEVVRRIVAAGRIPMVQRVPFQTKYREDYAAPLAAAVDEVAAAHGLVPGPDLYGWFKARPGELRDALHPDDAGSVEMSWLWAEAARPFYEP
ncbi:MAG TPA: GDSL-type esterase/lipase family protein [Anaeromyxobacteraceae bacterium]|nr:GDSL-type esterase/lipase family protein [Anaeromyxobacteraceae bacterium]